MGISVDKVENEELIMVKENEMPPKKRVYATIREDLVEWMDQEIEKLRFASRSHAIEYALAKLKEEKNTKASLFC